MPRIELDPSLIGGGNGVNAFASAYQNALANSFKNKATQQELDANQFKMDGLRQEQEQSNKLAQLMAGQGFDPSTPQGQAQMYGVGGVTRTQAVLKGQSDLAYKNAETGGKTQELIQKQMALHANDLAGVENPQQMAQWMASNYNDPITKDYYNARGNLQQAVSKIPQTPEEFTAFKQKLALGMRDFFIQSKPTIATRNLGDRTDTIATDGLSGVTRVVNSAVNGQSPDSVASNTTSRENAQMVDARTRESTAATREVAMATRDAAKTTANQATEMKFADDYRNQSKDFKAVGDAYRQINSTLDSASKSPAATLAAATKFMKLLDPGSVVRESELGMAMAASGVIDRATNYVNVLQSGRVLTPTQVKDFKAITEQIYGASQEGQRQIDATYKEYARANGLRPEMILQDLGQNKGKGAEKANQDSAAVAWAKANPNDPRAAKIMQLQGR